jgi:hypothetical protein
MPDEAAGWVLTQPHHYYHRVSIAPPDFTVSCRKELEELNTHTHVGNLRLHALEIALGSQLEREGEKSQRISTDAESAVHFRPFHPVPTLSFTFNVMLVESYPILFLVILFPMIAMNAARALCAWTQFVLPTPHPLDHYPRSLGVKAVLTLALP